ncbi:MAG: type II toxin-antitoxin system PemK/MazF family toxin [Phycicoccus sp.]
MNRGDVHLCDFGDPIGHEPAFRRPAVVISAPELSRFGLPVVLPVTRTKRDYPTHVELDGVLPVTCYVQCEQIRAVAGERLLTRVGALDPVSLIQVETILRRVLML